MQGALLEGYSFIRIALNIICNNVLSLVLRASVKDIGSGLNMYNVSYLKSQFYINFPNNLNYNVYMLFYGYYKKANTSFFPISWREDDQVSNARLVRQGIEILWIIIKYLLSPKTLFYRKSCTKNRSYLFDTVSKNK
jgi:hypothetical protein